MTELILSLDCLVDELDMMFLSYENLSVAEDKFIKIVNPGRSVRGYLVNTFQILKIFNKVKPRMVISTGAGISIPALLIGKYIFNARIIFIESLAYLDRPTKTGRFVYRFADHFIVNTELQKLVYPRAKVGGL